MGDTEGLFSKTAKNAGDAGNYSILSAFSPTSRSATVANQRAVIRSPMAMTTSNARSTVAPLGRAVDASPVSTTTAAEYAEIEQKQVELRSVVEHRIVTLERSLQRREEELEAVRAQLRKTEEDYQFNYELIKDRDAALEEAATQLQSLYDELRRCKSDGSTAMSRLGELEQETHQLRKRVREAETEREEMVERMRQAYEVKEKQLKETLARREASLETEKQRLHEEYLRRFKTLDDTRVEVAAKSESLAIELEKRWGKHVERLEKELRVSIDAAHNAQRERATSEGCLAEVSQALALLKNEHDALQQRHQHLLANAAEKQRCLEEKLSECTTIMGNGIANAEDGIRQQTHRATKLEVECTQLQSQVTELQERLQATRLQRDEDMKRFMDEGREMQDRYRHATVQMEEQRQMWSETERQLTLRIQRLQNELEDTQKEASLATARAGEYREQHEASEKAQMLLEKEMDRVRRELQRCREEEQRTAAHAQEVQRVADENVRAAYHDVETAHEEIERQKKLFFELQERSQAETARLTRELHASEVARRTLEDHYHLAEDNNGQRMLIENLRREKEGLGKKVIDLENTNAAIREQVASFTMELQNDPAMKSAKEMQHRLQELQGDLFRARDDNQRLHNSLREKEEEISRYKLEMLRIQSMETAAVCQRDREDQRIREEYQTAKDAYERMRQSLKAKQQRRHRTSSGKLPAREEHHQHNISEISGGGGSSSNSNESSSDSERAASGHRKGRGARKDRRHKSRKADTLVNDDMMLRHEADMWQKKYLLLEKQTHSLLLERDRLVKEVHLARQDVDALTSEKQSLLDLNSLLKAQLREAYRTALDYTLCQQEPQKQQQQLMNVAMPPGQEIVRDLSQPVPRLAVDSVLGATKTPKLSADAERLAVLEEELAAMKAHMLAQRQGVSRSIRHGGSTSPVSAPSGLETVGRASKNQQHAVSCVPQGSSGGRNKGPVVHRGSSTVRHYGYL